MKTNKARKLLALALALCLVVGCLPMAASAEGETSGNCGPESSESSVTWSYDESTKTLTISGTGPMKDYSDIWWENHVPWRSFYYEVETVVVEEGVTSIGTYAFAHFPMENCSLPISLKSIGAKAFLKSDIKSLSVPEGVTEIGTHAFRKCTSFSSISLPSTLQTIGEGAFELDTELSVTIPANVNAIGERAFRWVKSVSVASGNSNFVMENGALLDKAKTKMYYLQKQTSSSYIIPSTVTEIGECVFEDNDTLTSVQIPEGVTKIAYSAFASCDNLSDVTLPSTLQNLGGGAFDRCGSLTTMNIPAALEEINVAWNEGSDDSTYSGTYPSFGSCYSMETLTLDAENSSFTVEDNILYTKDKTELILYPANRQSSSWIVPSEMESIAIGAFIVRNNLKTISVENGNTNYLVSGGILYCKTSEWENDDGTHAEYDLVACPPQISGQISVANPGTTAHYYINFPNNGNVFSGNAFAGCHKISSISLDDGIWGENRLNYNSTFHDCPQLENVNISENDEEYKSIDGVVYTKDGSELVYCPPGRSSLTVEDGTTEIGSGTFWDHQSYSGREPCFDHEAYPFNYIYVPSSVQTITNSEISLGYCYSNKVVVYGESGSAAETYINEYSDCYIFRVGTPDDYPMEPDWSKVLAKSSVTYGTANSGVVTVPSTGTATNGDDITVSGKFTVLNADEMQDAGSRTVTVQFTVTTAGDYKDMTFNKDYIVEIAKKPITVKADNITRVYGEAMPLPTYTVPAGALVGDDVDDVLGVELTTRDGTAAVGTYPITGTAESDNYAVTVTPGTLTVVPANLSGAVTITETNGTGISGTIDVGDTLTANVSRVTPAGAVSGLTYQWSRDGKAVGGATAAAYTVTEADAGATLSVAATASGNYSGSLSASIDVGKIVLSGTAAISGDSNPAAVGDVLTATLSVNVNAENYDIAWTRDGTAISGATGTTYTIAAADQGKTIAVKATAKGASYTGEVVSSGISVPANVPDAPALTLTPSSGKITAKWTAPADNGAAITGYTLAITDGADYSDTVSVDGAATSYAFTSLTNGTVYTVTITAANSVGTGVSAEKTATPNASTGGGSSTPSVPDPVVTENPDGSTTTTETAADGTVTATTTWSDGKEAVQVATPEGGLTITVTSPEGEKVAEVSIPAQPGEAKEFVDVNEGDWFKPSVDGATGYGLFSGTSETTFSPNTPMTRGMLVQVLHNLSGNPEYGVGDGNFEDVQNAAWYSDAVDWAAKAGVVYGTSATEFSPNVSISREQLVTMLYRYAEGIGAGSKNRDNLTKFPDSGKVSGYAKDAMQWAVAEGLIVGRGNVIAPQGTATRAEVAAVLTRFTAYLVK